MGFLAPHMRTLDGVACPPHGHEHKFISNHLLRNIFKFNHVKISKYTKLFTLLKYYNYLKTETNNTTSMIRQTIPNSTSKAARTIWKKSSLLFQTVRTCNTSEIILVLFPPSTLSPCVTISPLPS